MASKNKVDSSTIVINKKARFDFFIEQDYEAGLALEGWEVKSLREGKVNLSESHVLIKRGEAFLFGCQIQPLPTASTHDVPDPIRTRKLLLNKKEISQLIGAVERKGYTVVPLKLYWLRNRVKCKIALAKGKKTHDKREVSKDRDWQRSKARIMKHS